MLIKMAMTVRLQEETRKAANISTSPLFCAFQASLTPSNCSIYAGLVTDYDGE